MACIDMPAASVPTLPGGIGVGFALPGASFNPAFCCKILQTTVSISPTPIGVPLNPALIASINTIIDQVNDFFAQLGVTCPKEL